MPLPPLRDRPGDLPLLIAFSCSAYIPAGHKLPDLLPRLAALSTYPFPGNVRELAHAVQHAAVLAGHGDITLDHLPAAIAEEAPSGPTSTLAAMTVDGAPQAVVPLSIAVREFEKGHLRRALAATGGKRVKAAEMLGISRKSLWEKLRMYEVDESTPKPEE